MRLLFLAWLLAPAHGQADELGRLFHTPEQRARMDRTQPESDMAQPAEPALNGIVQRSDGARTYWLDGAARSADGDGTSPDTQAVTFPGRTAPVILKVGRHPAAPDNTQGETEK